MNMVRRYSSLFVVVRGRTSGNPSFSDNDDPNNPDDASGATNGKKKKKEKQKKKERGKHRPRESKTIATSKIVVNLPEFAGKDLSEFADSFHNFQRMIGQTYAKWACEVQLASPMLQDQVPREAGETNRDQVRHVCDGKRGFWLPLRGNIRLMKRIYLSGRRSRA